MHHLYASLRAHALFHRDQHYVVQDGEVVIVDEFTGRLMPGRRWSDGLHQAVEAKEGVRDPEGEPDARLDHVPELLPHVPEARRHDGHRGHRGLRVPADLQPGNRGHPDAHADGPRGPHGSGVPHDQGRRSGGHRRHQGLLRARPAGAGGHDLDRELRAASRHAGKGEASAQGAEREAARARGRDRRAGRAAEDGHHRHQHGGPRHRHRPRRQPGAGDQPVRADEALSEEDKTARVAEIRARVAGAARPGRGAGGLHIVGTERHESRRVDNQLRGRSGPPGRPGIEPLLPLARGSAAAHLRLRSRSRDHGEAEDARRRGDRASLGHARDRERAAQGRGAQLRHSQAAAGVRRRRQRPAQA